MALLRSRSVLARASEWEPTAPFVGDRRAQDQLRELCRDRSGERNRSRIEYNDAVEALGYTAQFLWDQRVLEPLRAADTHKVQMLILASTLSGLVHPDKSRDAAQGHTDYNARTRKRLSQWFWASTFDRGRLATRDLKDERDALLEWIRDESGRVSAPDVVHRTTAPSEDEIADWRFGTRPHKAVAALLARLDPRDLLTGERIAAEQAFAGRINSHHLFPRAWAKEHPDRHDVERVVNTAAITGYTNRWIGKHRPSEYLATLDRIIGATQVTLILQDHRAPESQLRNDDWPGFRDERANRIRSLISAALSGD